jgi:hypothetical protein
MYLLYLIFKWTIIGTVYAAIAIGYLGLLMIKGIVWMIAELAAENRKRNPRPQMGQPRSVTQRQTTDDRTTLRAAERETRVAAERALSESLYGERSSAMQNALTPLVLEADWESRG